MRELSHERNWSELPQEILHLFSKKLPDISDFIRFRAVCKTWQLSAPVNDPPPQLPWLLLDRRNGVDPENGIMRFYCLSSKKVHTITCPGSRRAWLRGPGCRYLLATHLRNSEMYLLNPLTRDQIHLPFFDGRGIPDYIGPDPIQGSDIVVVVSRIMPTMDPPSYLMAFWRPNADNWVYVEGVSDFVNAFCMGKYFSNNRENNITNVFDMATQKLDYQIAPPEGRNPPLLGLTYMVESGGKILRLFRYYETGQCHFDIHCLYFGDELKPYWVKIIDIGDQMLFLQRSTGLSFCASNFAGFKGNCIYFENDLHYLCRYDIGDGTTKVLPIPYPMGYQMGLFGSWFVPSLV